MLLIYKRTLEEKSNSLIKPIANQTYINSMARMIGFKALYRSSTFKNLIHMVYKSFTVIRNAYCFNIEFLW